MNVVFLCPGFPGVARVGEEGQKVGWWQFIRLDDEPVALPMADVYILGAWHPYYERLLELLPPRAAVGVCWTSSLGEMELNAPVEREYLEWVLTHRRIGFVWFGDPSLAKLYPERGFHHCYPILYAPQEPQAHKQDIITLFCPDKPGKNILNQLAAVQMLQQEQPELVLHTNVRQDWPGLRLVRHGWLPRPEYEALLASARVNLAVTWSETFAYQVAEAVLLGTPSVVGPATSWVLKSYYTASNPNSPQEICISLKQVLADSQDWCLKMQRSTLSHYASLGGNLTARYNKSILKSKDVKPGNQSAGGFDAVNRDPLRQGHQPGDS